MPPAPMHASEATAPTPAKELLKAAGAVCERLGATVSCNCVPLGVDERDGRSELRLPAGLGPPLARAVHLQRRWQEHLPALPVVFALDVPTAVVDLLVLASMRNTNTTKIHMNSMYKEDTRKM